MLNVIAAASGRLSLLWSLAYALTLVDTKEVVPTCLLPMCGFDIIVVEVQVTSC